MKVQITKLGNGNVQVELTHNQSKKPMTVELSPAQVESLTSMLALAVKADNFKFSFETT